MTVNTVNSTAEFVTNGVSTVFPFFFKFLEDSDLVVTYVDPLGAVTTLSLGTNFSVSGAGSETGGSITTTAALAGPGQLIVSREMDPFQLASLRNQGKFLAETHENVFDKLTMLIQQALSVTRRALMRPFGRNYYDAENRLIKNLAAPVDFQDAATKRFVQELIAGVISSGQGAINNAVNVLYAATGGLSVRSVKDRLDDIPVPLSYGAAGNGVTNDTAALAAFEAQYSGRTIDLGGKTFLVTTRPTKNSYINGKFKVGNANFASDLYNGFLTGQPKFNSYGMQLRSLKEALGNPLVQFIGIVGVGDSITWGRTLPDNSPVAPQTQLLTTARDNASSPSWWNNVRRYIAAQYLKGATEARSNWAVSPSGESIVTYTKSIVVYPKDGPFTLVATGGSQSVQNAANSSTISGWRYVLADGTPGRSSNQAISFQFTGTQFDFVFQCSPNDDNNNYDVLVDGVLIGTYSTQPGVDGIVVGYNQRRTHSFTFMQNKTVTIRTNSTGFSTVRRIYIEGLEIPKTVRFSNQGVIGQTARTYDLYNLSGSYSNPTAVTAMDKFIFLQFGTNDRGDTGVPPGIGEFQRSMQQILNRLMPLGEVILMCAGPVADSIEPPATGYMTMRDVRGVLSKMAKANSLVFIDNLAAFDAVDPGVILDGTTHPNALGHAIMARNIINAFEAQ